MIASLVQCTSLVKSAGCPQSLPPFIQERCQELHCFPSHFAIQRLPFFIVLERLNAAEMSVTCLEEVHQPICEDHGRYTYVKPCTALPRLRVEINTDIHSMRDALTLHPPERFPRCTIQRGWCIAKNPDPNQPRSHNRSLI